LGYGLGIGLLATDVRLIRALGITSFKMKQTQSRTLRLLYAVAEIERRRVYLTWQRCSTDMFSR